MDLQSKIIILSKFFSKERIQGDSLLEKLFELDDIWSKVYEENRIKYSFSTAKEMANEKVLTHVLSINYSSNKNTIMLPIEKAKEIFDKIYNVEDTMGDYPMCYETTKKCANILVEEVIKEFDYNSKNDKKQGFWQQVKKEIELL